MSALICGSLAFDTITNFPGRFSDQIVPDRVHILNVSFLVPTLRREWGGCAGNIAYTLKALGGEPVVLAAIGFDGNDYMLRLKQLAIDTSVVRVDSSHYTAQAIIMTDVDNNQITAFHPGAMSFSHEAPVPARSDIGIAIIAPDGREAMLAHAQQLAAAQVPFVFDPGQGLPMFNGQELSTFVDQARWVAVNDYEGQMLCDRIGQDVAALSQRPHLHGVIVTLGPEGCDVWQQGVCTRVPGVKASAVVDPTGCGDALRAGLLYGLERGWPLERCVALGNRLGALKIAHQGGQNHVIPTGFAGMQ
jgi:adenosine kinase